MIRRNQLNLFLDSPETWKKQQLSSTWMIRLYCSDAFTISLLEQVTQSLHEEYSKCLSFSLPTFWKRASVWSFPLSFFDLSFIEELLPDPKAFLSKMIKTLGDLNSKIIHRRQFFFFFPFFWKKKKTFFPFDQFACCPLQMFRPFL